MQKIEYNPKYPKKHLSIRVPWHDNKWNGTICTEPSKNSACTALNSCAQKRSDQIEEEFAGIKLPVVKSKKNYTPPCVVERGTFMSDLNIVLDKKHPYINIRGYHLYKDLGTTTLTHKAKSAAAIPFNWLSGAGAKSKKEIYPDIDFDRGREPYMIDSKVYAKTKSWIQVKANQKALLDCFFEHVQPKKSLVLFYASQVPFVESNERIVVGIGFVDSISQNGSYPTNGRLESMLWEHTVDHSIRLDGKKGFLLPYHEAIEVQKSTPGIDLEDLAIKVPNEYRSQFLYTCEHVSDDALLYILNECKSKLPFYQKLGLEGNWLEISDWVQDQIARIVKLRGDYPGLGAILRAIGVDHGFYLAQSLVEQSPDQDPWSVLIEKIKGDPKSLTKYGINEEIREHIIDEEYLPFYQLVSRFDLSYKQCQGLRNHTSNNGYLIFTKESAITNPYVLFESSILAPDEYRIPFHTIDNGLLLKRDKTLFPELEPYKYIPSSKYRWRALVVQELEKALTEGHTLLSFAQLKHRIEKLSLDPAMHFADGVQRKVEVLSKKDNKLLITKIDKDSFYQLSRIAECSKIIREEVSGRLRARRRVGKIDWISRINEHFDCSSMDNQTKVSKSEQLKGLREKAEGLKELFESPFSILMGSAGTGKTNLLNIFCNNDAIKNGGVIILTPTGKSRVRVEQESTDSNIEVMTLAQFLRKSGRYSSSAQRYILRPDQKKTSSYKTLVIDEASMLTEEMLAVTFDAFVGLDRIILVGDPKQLPPIGGGRPFVDIINYIKPTQFTGDQRIALGYVELTVAFRDIGNAVKLANFFTDEKESVEDDEIVNFLSKDQKDLTISIWDNTDLKFRDVLIKVLRDQYGIRGSSSFMKMNGKNEDGNAYVVAKSTESIENWQILSPVRGNEHGVIDINRYLHKTFLSTEIAKYKYPGPLGSNQIVVGDKVICVSNTKKLKYDHINKESIKDSFIANGEIGLAVYRAKGFLNVEFTSQIGSTYGFSDYEFNDDREVLELAYALTIHKAQGSQFKRTIVVFPYPCFNLTRELVYTALTRQIEGTDILLQGNLNTLLRYRSKLFSDTYNRLTNLFQLPNIVAHEENNELGKKIRYFDKNHIHCTSDGTLVISKSELVIYEALTVARLNPIYEKKLHLGEIIVKPDFTISLPFGGGTVYWEHLGMLSNAKYGKDWERKKETYRRNGIVEGDNLFISMDDERGGLSMKDIQKVISEILGRKLDDDSKKEMRSLIKPPRLVSGIDNLIEARLNALHKDIAEIKADKVKSDQELQRLIVDLGVKIDRSIDIPDDNTYKKKVKKSVPQYIKLLPTAQRFLVESYFIRDMIKKGNKDTYDAFILQHIRSVEYDLLHRIFEPFAIDLKQQQDDIEVYLAEEYKVPMVKPFAKAISEDQIKLTLGQMNFILNLIKKESGKTLNSSPLLKELREYTGTLIDLNLLKSPFLKDLEYLISQYRNGAAHDRSYSKSEAKEYKEKCENVIAIYLQSIIHSKTL